MEMEAFDEGLLSEINVKDGEKVEIGQLSVGISMAIGIEPVTELPRQKRPGPLHAPRLGRSLALPRGVATYPPDHLAGST